MADSVSERHCKGKCGRSRLAAQIVRLLMGDAAVAAQRLTTDQTEAGAGSPPIGLSQNHADRHGRKNLVISGLLAGGRLAG